MLRHIITAALRNMAANRLLSGIAILGLAVGITAVLVVVSLIRGIERWDQFIPGYDRTIVVTMPALRSGAAHTLNSDPRTAEMLRLALPEVENAARLISEGAMMKHGNVTATQRFYWADPSVSAVLPFPVYRGDLRAALSSPDGMALERNTARKFFGRDDVVGETLILNGRPRMVRAVLEDLPTQTEFSSATLVSALSPDTDPRLGQGGAQNGLGDGGLTTVLRLRPGVVLDTLRQRAHDAIKPVLAARPFHGGGPDADAPLLLRIDRTVWSEKVNQGFQMALALGSSIGLLLLFLASVNFVNMMTARATRRANEVGMRKVCGAGRSTLILQFLGESILVVFASLCIALALHEWLLGRINGLGQAVPLDFWRNPPLLAGLLLGAVLIGVAAGAWPAFVLSSFRPVRVLKGVTGDVGKAGLIRNCLVILQFAALVGFMIAAMVIYQQHRFAIGRPLGVQTDGLFTMDTECRPAFMAELRKLPGVAGASCTGEEFFSNNNALSFVHQGAAMSMGAVRVDWNVFALYGIRPLAGSLPMDSAGTGLVLNQAAVRKLGYASPQVAIGQMPASNGKLAGRAVMAVVPDFALYSIERPMEAAIFVPMDFIACCERVSVRLRPENISETLSAIDRLWANTGGGYMRRTSLKERLQSQYDGLLQNANLFAICALVAVFLGCLGLTGLAVSNAERRTKEIGVRKAMGATASQVVAQLLWQFSRPVLLANLIAWPIAFWLMQDWLAGFAYRIDLHWWIFAAASAVTLLIALATVAGQAWTAARQKPVLALRYE